MFQTNRTPAVNLSPQPITNLHLVPEAAPRLSAASRAASHLDLVAITARRCSAFFAEAAVLVLVFGILDLFLVKGRIELRWLGAALALSVGLLAASIVTDVGAHRWIRAHP